MAELELGHVGMATGDSAFERAGKFIKVDAAAEVAERRRVGVTAFTFDTDGVAAPAEFPNQCLATCDRIGRRRGAGSKSADECEKRRNAFHARTVNEMTILSIPRRRNQPVNSRAPPASPARHKDHRDSRRKQGWRH